MRIYDNLERVEDSGAKDGQGNVIFHITTDARVIQQKQQLQAACDARKLDCTYIFSADLNGNGELDNGEPDFNNGELLLPDRVPRESSVDGRQARIVYGGKNGSTRLMDLHLQKGMHCVDCHFYQDLHGDGNLYTNNWDAVEIECEDCHGFKQKRSFELNPGRLLTSGASGGNDLMKALDSTGRPFFEVRKKDGKQTLWQRSRVQPGLEWQVTQVADVDVSTANGDPHSDAHIATGPRDPGKLECYSCHDSWGENCLSCHYQQNYKKQQREVFLTGGTQPAKTDFQLFGIVRSPFVLGVDGTVEQNRLSPFRSSMERTSRSPTATATPCCPTWCTPTAARASPPPAPAPTTSCRTPYAPTWCAGARPATPSPTARATPSTTTSSGADHAGLGLAGRPRTTWAIGSSPPRRATAATACSTWSTSRTSRRSPARPARRTAFPDSSSATAAI